jgi:hypothetical protein
MATVCVIAGGLISSGNHIFFCDRDAHRAPAPVLDGDVPSLSPGLVSLFLGLFLFLGAAVSVPLVTDPPWRHSPTD